MIQWLLDVLRWIDQLPWWQWALLSAGLFLVTFTVSLAVTAWVVVKLPATYFRDDHHPAAFTWADRHPALRWTLRVAKNLLGLFLVILGIVLSLPGMPGQGILTILIGLMLLDFPGRRRLEQKLVRRPSIRNGIDRLRLRFGQKPLVLDDEPAATPQTDAPQTSEVGKG
jgi:hypothetical protein